MKSEPRAADVLQYPLNSLIFEERAVRVGASARCHTTIHRRMRVLWPFHRCSASHAVGMGLGAELGTGFEGLFFCLADHPVLFVFLLPAARNSCFLFAG